MNNNTTAFLIVIAVLVAGFFLLRDRKVEEATVVNNVTNIEENWVTASSTTSDFTFLYPITFGTKYITPVEWPPKVVTVAVPYACVNTGSENLVGGKTMQITEGDRVYCLTVAVEGAAGSTYTKYSYISKKDAQSTILLDFSTKSIQCENYDNPEKNECILEQKDFDINKIVDQIFLSISMK